jgi:hypothetical protein
MLAFMRPILPPRAHYVKGGIAINRHQIVTGSEAAERENQGSILFCWRPRRDLNPCYRRERGIQTRLALFAWVVKNSYILTIHACFLLISSLPLFGRIYPGLPLA